MTHYQVLARKWRPTHLEQVVGQDYIKRILSNALEHNRIHHAYLFTGTRGVGKTTIARILAKCLNCAAGPCSTPCGKCPSCLNIDAGKFLDLFEIDAASRTKVEDMRELLENVAYPPVQGRYKIYLIDEVHMLSNHSFNALLKTLEEPPEHVKFLLATTDPKRLPITILSRCLQFHLKRIPQEYIGNHLRFICEQENISCEQVALDKLAKAADGSLRDAISLLEQAVAFGSGAVQTQEVIKMLGTIEREDLWPILQALQTKNYSEIFNFIAHMSELAVDFFQVLDELIHLLHQIAIVQVLPDTESPFHTLAQSFSPEDIQLYYQIALLGKRDLAYAASPRQGFEMTILRMIAFTPHAQEQNIIQNKTEVKVADIPVVQPTAEIPKQCIAEWRDILPKLELTGMAYALAANCSLLKIGQDSVELCLLASQQPMLNNKLKERIAEALSRHFQRPIQLVVSISKEEIITPAKQEQERREQHLQEAKQNFLQQPLIKQLIEMYDGSLEVSLLS